MSTEQMTNTTAGVMSHVLNVEPIFVLPLLVFVSFCPLVPFAVL